MSSPVVIIGLDGATFDLILPWIENGKLPFLRETMKNGVYGELKSTIPMLSPTAWSSFMTGVNPGKHGILGFFTRKRNSYAIEVINAKHRKIEEFWILLNKIGKKVGIVNVPLTYPPKRVNGFIISGMMTPPGAKDYVYPNSLKEKIRVIIGEDTIDPLFTYLEGEEVFTQKLFDSTEKLAKICFSLIKEYKPELFAVVFNGTDYIQHKFWHFLDRKHPRYDIKKAAKFQKIILSYYQFLDKIIAKIYSLAGKNATLIIVSDHGAGPLLKYFHVNPWLLHNGFLALKKNIRTKLRECLYKVGLAPEKIYNCLLRVRVGNLGFKGHRTDVSLRRTLERLFLSVSDVNWKKTKAFSIGSGLIYINLKGRDPHGIVNPGEEYEKLRDTLIYMLKKYRDPETKQPVIKEVYRKEEVYSGPFLEEFPDLILVPNSGYMTFEEYEFGSYTVLTYAEAVSATHKSNGIILMRGPQIKKGLKLNEAEIVDVAPTVLYLFGIPIPSYMDGRPLYEAMASQKIAKQPKEYPIKYTGPNYTVNMENPYTPEEEEQIKLRLKRLGYIS
ncbi:hypothetical protein DRO54_08130 [Candidatus Bathyarchaeota archaeon]|nr:MAG: hypothetical protein DRO54_08130 [Candidatus Bathyarchaeota archaeon]